MRRRILLKLLGMTALGAWPAPHARPPSVSESARMPDVPQRTATNSVTLFLCGDVMTGRGIDQVLPHPSAPHLYESYVTTAKDYVHIAEEKNGPIPEPVDFAYPWGDALAELERAAPDARIINLETAVTRSDDAERKGINYRMHPDNVPVLAAAKIDCCVLANNHVLDWGRAGLEETLLTLRRAGIQSAGAGRNLTEAENPAVLEIAGKGRVLVFAFGDESSGVARHWRATANKPGVNFLDELSAHGARRIAEQVRAQKRSGDVVVASIHWGENWGYHVPDEQVRFAHRLIDSAAVDVVHGHSSHHPKGVEVYKNKPILYGCGDFINDYEGISGYEEFRDDLALMYFVSLDGATGRLVRFEMVPLRMQRFSLHRAQLDDAQWLRATLDRESSRCGARVHLTEERRLILGWE
jgi:poly-gamma-glutamate synthesis protein (capsule biosynthesis protein)